MAAASRATGANLMPVTHVRRINGIRMHFLTYGSGPVAVVLCHGFPELALSWHVPATAIAEAGYRVVVPDMRGYGATESPADVDAFSMKHITQDMVALLDHLRLRRAVFVGHDWGGGVVWSMALHHPSRVQAVAGINTPLVPHAPAPPLELIALKPGRWDYQLYFQEEGVAEKELEADVGRTLLAFIRTVQKQDAISPSCMGLSTRGVRERGGVLVGLPATVPPSSLLPPSVFKRYVAAFSRSGFRGPLNWYRNINRNWEWDAEAGVETATVRVPALMVTAGGDAVLTPAMSEGMEERVPMLTREHHPTCSHWTQFEEPEWLAQKLVQWLRKAAPLARL